MEITERFLGYAAFDTQSDPDCPDTPSTGKQFALARHLVAEMRAMGIADAEVDDNCYVYGTVPGAAGAPVIGLIAHMDTSPDCSDADKQLAVVEYRGGDLTLNAAQGIVLRPADFDSLARNTGKHLIVTDGTTLLGADDKAGIAEILTAAERLLAQTAPHATLRICFTPDEEIGRGADAFDVSKFAADYAYTVDGGTLGELEYENFNAAAAVLTVHGVNIHPGSAKGKMRSALLMAMEFNALLPPEQIPARTEGYEGFFHLNGMEGTVERATLDYIIRDHDRALFEQKKALFAALAEQLNAKYGAGTAEAEITDSYYNMKEQILPHLHIVDRAVAAMEAEGIPPRIVPIRGGTDGARLSYMGLPCPNLCTGGENFHGRFEYIPVEDMEAVARLLVRILTDAAGTEG